MLVIAMQEPSKQDPLEQRRAHAHAASLDVALDFVNTLELEGGEPVDHIPTTAEALDWLLERGLLHATQSAHVDTRLRRIRSARASLRELVDAAVEHRAPAPSAVGDTNRLLRARDALELVPDGSAVALGHVHVGDPIDAALARLADPIAREVSSDRRERLRICANDRCRYVFVDTSRTGRRRWCDMSSCGNRAKAARHRARAKADQTAIEPAAREAASPR